MKYIKTFENMDYEPSGKKFTPKYYILVGKNETKVKLIDYDKVDDFMPYKVEFANGEIGWIPAGKFQRGMSKEEIEEFELNKTANKYNI